jgi:hypothetical protein
MFFFSGGHVSTSATIRLADTQVFRLISQAKYILVTVTKAIFARLSLDKHYQYYKRNSVFLSS